MQKAVRVVEVSSAIFGVISFFVWVWALIFPGEAVEALKRYEARFSAAEETWSRVEADTKQLVDALPKGVVITELFSSAGCDAVPNSDDSVSIILENREAVMLNDFSIRVVGEAGSLLHSETGGLMSPGSQRFLDLKGRNRPSAICISYSGVSRKAVRMEYRVEAWSVMSDTCRNNPEYGFQMHTAAFRRLNPKETTGCSY